MDLLTQLPPIVTPPPQAQLWIGPERTTQKHVITYLQKILCPNNGCNSCFLCIRIAERQHHALHWIAPEKQYKIEHLVPMLDALSFKLDDNMHAFFIIQKGDLLTSICANKLLKPLEQPPHGYHFIILAERADRILDTIKSRCVSYTWHESSSGTEYTELFAALSSYPPHTPISNILLQALPNEQETPTVLDLLIAHWVTETKKTVMQNNTPHYTYASAAYSTLHKAARKLPMPGGALLFWKNVILGLHGIKKM